MRLVGFLLFFFCMQNCLADRLTLKNDDQISGDVLSIEAGRLKFHSPIFGDLELDLNQVASFESDKSWILTGSNKPCLLEDLNTDKLLSSCENLSVDSVPIALSTPEENRPPSYDLKGDLSLSGAQSRGNKDESDWQLAAGFDFRRQELRHIVKLDYESKSRDDNAPDEEYKLRYSLNWFFKERWFWSNSLEVGASEKKRIDERYALSSGFGFQIWDKNDKALSVESGLSYIRETFDLPADASADLSASKNLPSWRWAVEYRQKLPFSTELNYSQAVLYSFGDFKEWDFEADLSLNVPIAAGLFSKFKLEYDYDSEPQEGKKKADIKSSIGIGYEW